MCQFGVIDNPDKRTFNWTFDDLTLKFLRLLDFTTAKSFLKCRKYGLLWESTVIVNVIKGLGTVAV